MKVAQRWATIPDRFRVRIARSMVAGSAALGLFSLWAYASRGEVGSYLLDGRIFDDWIVHNVVLGSFGMSLLVWFAIRSQPRNGAVWALAWSSLFQGINAAANAWVLLASHAAGIDGRAKAVPFSELPLSVAIPLQLGSWTWIPGLVLLLTLVLLLLPDGRLLSRRWRPVAWGSVASITALSAAFFWMARPREEAVSMDTVDPPWLGPFFLPVLASIVACTAGLIIRYRASRGEQRVRLRWIAWGGAVWGLSSFTFPVAWNAPSGLDIFSISSIVTGTALLVAFYIAITKYRLYDIDTVASRTLMLTGLLFAAVGLYIGVVVLISAVIGAGWELSRGPQVVAAVVVAIAFDPLRRWMQNTANRVVYGQRRTPYEVLATFSHGAAEASDDELMQRIPDLIVEGTVASEATIWLEAGEVFRATGSAGATARTVAVASSFADPEADFSVPIYHDDELLGGLSLVLERGEELPPPERDLVEQLAAGLGLAMRNARLTSQLRNQVAELEASRERILAAADEARRDLERDLDSGPQQRLVALKVKLGPTRMRAASLGAEKTAGVLAQLESEAGDAIQAVRDFSSGVFPPLLEAEGVVAAIRQRVQGTALPVHVNAHGIGRHPREVEAATYFAILEALQNVAKYANASQSEVVVSETEHELTFKVIDDGDGFDVAAARTGSGLANMADRLDAVGGNLEIESSPGEGTVVSGSIPIAALALV